MWLTVGAYGPISVANLYQYWFPTRFSAANEKCFEQGPLVRSNLEIDVVIIDVVIA